MVAIHNYDTISFNYVKVPALAALAGDAVVVAVELVRVGGRPAIGKKEAAPQSASEGAGVGCLRSSASAAFHSRNRA